MYQKSETTHHIDRFNTLLNGFLKVFKCYSSKENKKTLLYDYMIISLPNIYYCNTSEISKST